MSEFALVAVFLKLPCRTDRRVLSFSKTKGLQPVLISFTVIVDFSLIRKFPVQSTMLCTRVHCSTHCD